MSASPNRLATLVKNPQPNSTGSEKTSSPTTETHPLVINHEKTVSPVKDKGKALPEPIQDLKGKGKALPEPIQDLKGKGKALPQDKGKAQNDKGKGPALPEPHVLLDQLSYSDEEEEFEPSSEESSEFESDEESEAESSGSGEMLDELQGLCEEASTYGEGMETKFGLRSQAPKRTYSDPMGQGSSKKLK